MIPTFPKQQKSRELYVESFGGERRRKETELTLWATRANVLRLRVKPPNAEGIPEQLYKLPMTLAAGGEGQVAEERQSTLGGPRKI